MIAPRRLMRQQILERLSGERGQALTPLSWWAPAFVALDDPAIHELLLVLPRQSGKSQWLAAAALAEVLTTRDAYVLLVSASEAQQQAVFLRKIRRPLERLLRQLGLTGAARITQRGLEVSSLGSVLEVVAPNEATAPGRSPTLLLLDEAREIPDEVYETLVPSVIGAGGKIVIASTPGRPQGFLHALVMAPGPGTWLYRAHHNENPHASKGLLTFLRERLSLINPAAAQRELDAEFVESGEGFLPWPLIDAAVDPDWRETVTSPLQAYAGLDLSRKRDLTSLIVLLRRAVRGVDQLQVARLVVWDPALSPTREVPFDQVRATLAEVAQRFPGLVKVLCDEGSEGGAVLPWARSQAALVTKIDGFVATVTSNMEAWSALAARLHGQTLTLPKHERLLAELRNLRQEPTAFGAKWRIVDASRRYHRDVAAALAMACYAAGAVAPYTPARLWMSGDAPSDPDAEAREWAAVAGPSSLTLAL